MKETPLMFSTDNVIRIVKGVKTQTRRTRGLDQINKHPDRWQGSFDAFKGYASFLDKASPNAPPMMIRCPYGGVGDQIWVKETYYNFQSGGEAVVYKAGLAWEKEERPKPADGWKSAMFMPKRLARIWLTLSEPCRIERVQEITGLDIIAEGLESAVAFGKDGWNSSIDWYSKQWDSLNAKRGYGWDENPYVWVITHNAYGVRLK